MWVCLKRRSKIQRTFVVVVVVANFVLLLLPTSSLPLEVTNVSELPSVKSRGRIGSSLWHLWLESLMSL